MICYDSIVMKSIVLAIFMLETQSFVLGMIWYHKKVNYTFLMSNKCNISYLSSRVSDFKGIGMMFSENKYRIYGEYKNKE